ncbi:MAG TPA: hypothetical protein DD416_10555 [Rhodobacteraceae bacterium]|nr:TetR/AcrR family transcriptional regulator [Rhodobacter sp.]HBN31636.1 hypothetical protein [Paracoccaceae bacterium]
MEHSARQSEDTTGATGLRGRKKAKRREVILKEAGKLFAAQGIEATTMAAIAEHAGVSPPTVFNYFGSKDNLLNSLIFEGAEATRTRWKGNYNRTDQPLADAITGFLGEVSDYTLRIAGKRVWRYAEAMNIRRPNTEFVERFSLLDSELVAELARFLNARNLELRSGQDPDPAFLADLFFDRWTAQYLNFIKKDEMKLETHLGLLGADIEAMVALLFTDDCAQQPTLTLAKARHGSR